MRFLRAILYLCVLMGVGVAGSIQAIGDDLLQQDLDANEFDRALERAEADAANRDQLIGRIAIAQAATGNVSSSKDTLRRINDVGKLVTSAKQVRNQAAGGATGADFDTLINLITATVAPNSWDTTGGPGAIVEFPGGVRVDTSGVLRRSKRARGDARLRLDSVLRVAKEKYRDDDPHCASDLRMVSLTRLQRELQLRAAFGEAPTEAMKHLAGIQKIQFLFLFPETSECVIAGPAASWASAEGEEPHSESSALLLDDFITLLKNAEAADGRFGCSITPKQANLAATKRFLATPTGTLKPQQTKRWVEDIRNTLGLQNISVNGIDPRSHVAHVLIEADYHMKLVGMGLVASVPDVPSYLDSIEPDDLPVSMDVLRWWFTLQQDAIQQDDTGNAFIFADQTVKLRSENEQVADSGNRIHTGKSTVLNQLFANRFTAHFDRLADQYPVYARLDNLFRLAIVAALLQNEEVQSKTGWELSWLASLPTAEGRAPREVPSIVNHRTIQRRHVVVGVSGGVAVNVQAAMKKIGRSPNIADLASSQNSATPRTPRNSEKWWWD